MRESRLGRASSAGRPAEDRGAIDITTLQDLNGTNLLPGATFTAPDDGNADDRTVLAVPLTTAVAPGEEISLKVAWTSRVPRTYARTGVIGNYYFIAQWFPKLGVLEDTGWNCHQFHANTEFFADFGQYNVRLEVPVGWQVGSTGTAPAGGTGNLDTLFDGLPAATQPMRRHLFAADDVHDFAWTTSPDFVEQRRLFDVSGLPRVWMRLLLQPEHNTPEQVDRHFAATAAALKRYGTWFGPYPYGQITIVDPVTIFNASQGGSTGGMEYPMLFTAGTRRWIAMHGEQPDAVTVHEAGHQFWYGMVATNEFEHAWMDEGLNTFSTARVIAEENLGPFAATERYFGGLVPWTYRDATWTREITGDRLDGYRAAARADVPATPTWQYWPGTAGAITYNKTALWLNTLERMLGWDTTQRILSTHFARGAFQHPTPAQFFAIANESSGTDLTWFFDAVYRSNAVFDYAVADVSNSKTPTGIDSVAAVRRNGDGVFPIDVKITFGDDSSVTEHWDGQSPWHAFHYNKPAPITRVEVDPAHVLLLDVNMTNNSWTAKPQTALAVRRWMLRWTTWAEEMLLSYAFFS
jgi:aminopeptidase N